MFNNNREVTLVSTVHNIYLKFIRSEVSKRNRPNTGRRIPKRQRAYVHRFYKKKWRKEFCLIQLSHIRGFCLLSERI
jgi:hypothetical protein